MIIIMLVPKLGGGWKYWEGGGPLCKYWGGGGLVLLFLLHCIGSPHFPCKAHYNKIYLYTSKLMSPFHEGMGMSLFTWSLLHIPCMVRGAAVCGKLYTLVVNLLW